MAKPAEPVPDEAEPARRGASPWNSLEISKLIMSGATPLALLLLGAIVSSEAAERADRRESALKTAAERREDSLRIENFRREDAQRRATERREDLLRRQALAREERIGLATADREDRLRGASMAREDILRGEATSLARYDRLIGRRMEIWDRLGPKLRTVRLTVVALSSRCPETYPCSRAAAVRLMTEVDDELQIYHPYFSRGFMGLYGEVSRASYRILNREGPVTEADSEAFSRAYYALVRGVVDEFALVIESPDRARRRR